MRVVLEKFPQQCQEALSFGSDIVLDGVERIFICGMGGSAFAGDVVKVLCGDIIPIEVVRDYNLPPYADDKSLVIAISYSGNTEETMGASLDAINRGCKFFAVSSGGKLEQFCERHRAPFVRVPSGIQPRNALGYLALPIMNILENNGFVRQTDWNSVITAMQKPSLIEGARKIAQLLKGKVPIIYSSQRLSCISYGWKTRINENSKMHAFSHRIPELNHNEMVAYTKKHPNFHTIIIRDIDDSFETKKRMTITQNIIQQFGNGCDTIELNGSTQAARLFYALYLGDWVSYFLALENGVDPEPVQIIEDFKKALKD